MLLKKQDPVGTSKEVTLQTGDYGFRDVTNVTRTVVQAGVVTIEGVNILAY